MAEWDDEDFEPTAVKTNNSFSNKWEGEDEDDDVKDNWEDEDEEKKLEEPTPESAETKPKPKKKIVEKKKDARRQMEEEEEDDEISLEERKRLQKESDLRVALETTFGEADKTSNLDEFNPTTKEEFKEFLDIITKKIQPFSKSEEYPIFIETLIRDVCVPMNSFDLKKIKTTVDNLYLEKQKFEKGDKAKKSKAKGKAKLKMDGDNVNLNQYSAYVDDYNEFDDFM